MEQEPKDSKSAYFPRKFDQSVIDKYTKNIRFVDDSSNHEEKDDIVKGLLALVKLGNKASEVLSKIESNISSERDIFYLGTHSHIKSASLISSYVGKPKEHYYPNGMNFSISFEFKGQFDDYKSRQYNASYYDVLFSGEIFILDGENIIKKTVSKEDNCVIARVFPFNVSLHTFYMIGNKKSYKSYALHKKLYTKTSERSTDSFLTSLVTRILYSSIEETTYTEELSWLAIHLPKWITEEKIEKRLLTEIYEFAEKTREIRNVMNS